MYAPNIMLKVNYFSLPQWLLFAGCSAPIQVLHMLTSCCLESPRCSCVLSSLGSGLSSSSWASNSSGEFVEQLGWVSIRHWEQVPWDNYLATVITRNLDLTVKHSHVINRAVKQQKVGNTEKRADLFALCLNSVASCLVGNPESRHASANADYESDESGLHPARWINVVFQKNSIGLPNSAECVQTYKTLSLHFYTR